MAQFLAGKDHCMLMKVGNSPHRGRIIPAVFLLKTFSEFCTLIGHLASRSLDHHVKQEGFGAIAHQRAS